jgi:hypothetical protein
VPEICSQLGVSGFEQDTRRRNKSPSLEALACFLEKLRELKMSNRDNWQECYTSGTRYLIDENLIPKRDHVPPIMSRAKASELLTRGFADDKLYVQKKFGKDTLFSDNLDRYSDNPIDIETPLHLRQIINQATDKYLN